MSFKLQIFTTKTQDLFQNPQIYICIFSNIDQTQQMPGIANIQPGIFSDYFDLMEKKKKEYSTAKILNHEDNLRLFSRCCLSLGVTSFFQKKAVKRSSFTGIFIYFCSTQMKTFVFLERGPLAVPEYRQCVCEPRSKCFNMKN